MSLKTRVLLVDSYDSFTFNLAALCRQAIPDCCIHIIRNDQFSLAHILPYLRSFSAIVVGPGPGSPDTPKDIGIVKDLWKLSGEHLLPIFGVCLGLQSLSIESGARLKRLNVVKHGQISRINHRAIDVFDGVGVVEGVRYHSLHVELLDGGEIEQLAWADDGLENGKVVMAVKHRAKPFWAVQYHPESARTTGGGLEVLRNFWRLAQRWAENMERKPVPWSDESARRFGPPWPPATSTHSALPSDIPEPGSVTTSILELPDLTVPTICELLGVSEESSPFILLESAAQPGRFSIIASLKPTSTRITYVVGDSFVTVSKGGCAKREELPSQDIWAWLRAFMSSRRACGGSPDVPFWGGLIGYLSYELGVYALPVFLSKKNPDRARHADVNLIFVERSIVLDSVTGRVFVQSTLPGDEDWIADTRVRLKRASLPQRGVVLDHGVATKRRRVVPSSPATTVTLPDKNLYLERIKLAKERLFAGDSYELCLTARTSITVPNTESSHDHIPVRSSSWELYKTLRVNNPAPHSAYLRLGPTTLLSSSPERFLSFSRPPRIVCQLRPIKGTVRKGPSITRAVAEQALVGSKKEVAENLMIVDLIRHDLHSVVGQDVQVKQFCEVEEYETVWQLVSVIEGRFASDTETSLSGLDAPSEDGWDVLKSSLPPGSMTGAPKKRSVEILQTLEDDNRSVYSGVFGYWCVGGGGDWSVTIRSCFKYDKGFEKPGTSATDAGNDAGVEEWVLGAGGAITALSDPEAEWDEMVVKLQSVLKSFGVVAPV